MKMNLYNIHCGFYDEEISEGIYEFHISIPVVANNLEDAKKNIRLNPAFIKKKMHIDGIQEIKMVDGFVVEMMDSSSQLPGQTIIEGHLHRDL